MLSFPLNKHPSGNIPSGNIPSPQNMCAFLMQETTPLAEENIYA
jgi:hypothetical protein